MIRIDSAGAVPLWKQIEDGIRHLVAAGALPAGAPAPSVRELARDLRVNPATVARAYQRLAEAGVLAVRRGEGTFVADAPPALPRGERSRALRDAADRYAVVARTSGASDEEALRAVEAALARIRPRPEREER